MGTLWVHNSISLESMKCWVCGLHFAVDDDFIGKKRQNGDGFRCPGGCSLTFGEGALKKQLRLANERADREKAWRKGTARDLETARRQHAATKGQLTKTKKRIAHGVCPCCKRTFKNMAAHMKTCHPNYEQDSP